MSELIEVESSQAGLRCDQLLRNLKPNWGLRTFRRLAKNGHIQINGKIASSGQHLKAGDQIQIDFPETGEQAAPREAGKRLAGLEIAAGQEQMPQLLRITEEVAWLFKPAGIHSVNLSGGNGFSVEQWLNMALPGAHLVQRLDYGTSGLLLAALNADETNKFRNYEKNGLTDKYYLALLSGPLEKSLVATCRLDGNKRKKVRISDDLGMPLNRTTFKPLKIVRNKSGKDDTATWTLCHIKSGQRHQIRAHAAHLGFPLLEDALYGCGSGNYYLRQIKIGFPCNEFMFLVDRAGTFSIPEDIKVMLKGELG